MKDLTPTHLKCGIGNCKAVYQMPDGRLLIVGDKALDVPAEGHPGVVGPGETAIIIDPAYFANVPR